MAKEAKVPALQGELVDIAVTLDKDDVAAILMSRAEEHIKGAIKTCKATDKKLAKELETLAAAQKKQLKALAAAHFETTAETLTAAATGLKVKSVKATTACSNFNAKGGRNKKGSATCELMIRGDKPHINWCVTQDAPFTAEVRQTTDKIKVNKKATDDNHQEWMEQRRKLADLPTLERRAKAAVAEQRLMASVEGKELVEMLDGQLEDSIKLLGVN